MDVDKISLLKCKIALCIPRLHPCKHSKNLMVHDEEEGEIWQAKWVFVYLKFVMMGGTCHDEIGLFDHNIDIILVLIVNIQSTLYKCYTYKC